MSCGVGHRLGSDPALLWLWCRLAATVPIRPLAWKAPYAAGAVLGDTHTQKTKKKIIIITIRILKNDIHLKETLNSLEVEH